MLKKTLTKAGFKKLDESLHALYLEKDGAYVLDLEGAEDEESQAAALTRSLEAERKRASELAAKLKTREDADDEAQQKLDSKKGDVDALEKSYKTKIEKADLAHKAEITRYKSAISKSMIEAEVGKLAGEFVSQKAGEALLRGRFAVDFEESAEGDLKPALRVLDEHGKPTASSVSDLRKEFLTNKEFSAILKPDSKASGGGSGSGGSVDRLKNSEHNQKPLFERSLDEQVAHLQSMRDARGEMTNGTQ